MEMNDIEKSLEGLPKHEGKAFYVFKVGRRIKFKIGNQTFSVDYRHDSEEPEREGFYIDMLTKALTELENTPSELARNHMHSLLTVNQQLEEKVESLLTEVRSLRLRLGKYELDA